MRQVVVFRKVIHMEVFGPIRFRGETFDVFSKKSESL